MLDKKLKWFQLSKRQRMSPFPNYISMEAVTREMRAVFGYAYAQVILIFQENTFYGFMDKDDHCRVGQGILEQVKRRPDSLAKIAKKQQASAKLFYRFLKKNNHPSRLKKITNRQLAGLHQEYERRYKQIYARYFPILAMESYFFNYLRDYISFQEKDFKKAAGYLARLTTEPRAMVVRQEKVAALKLCAKIKENRRWRNYFRQSKTASIIAALRRDAELYRLIRQHERKFFWLTRDYEDPVLTLPDFIKQFQTYLQDNPRLALAKLIKEEQSLKAEIKIIYKKLAIDPDHQQLFQALRDGLYGKELRKSIVSQTLYYYDPILKEIARRAHLSLRQARHLLTAEVPLVLSKKTDLTHELNQRIKLSVYYTEAGKTRVYIGKRAQEYYNYLIKVDQKAEILYGTPVSPGLVTGPVKVVINPEDFPKVKKGDIIVTVQATPVFSPVLALAAGLICDGGTGITSHPATLARENDIPGVIGLRIATKLLHDGQRVAVDGEQGIVKLLKNETTTN